MAKGRSADQAFSSLAALKGAAGDDAAGQIAEYLASKTNLIAAKAADLAGEGNFKSLESQLVSAFWHFMRNPAGSDRGRAALRAIVNALYTLGCDAPDVFLKGIHHRQMEGGYGPAIDSAAELRGLCALGLVRMGYRQVMDELVDLLADESPPARMMAARAIAYAGREDGSLLLRLKLLCGDRDDQVLAECITALGTLQRVRAVGFIARFLDSRNSTLADSAAMALGEMRNDDALAMLLEQWQRDTFAVLRKRLVLPIALSRLDRAVEFLIGAIEAEHESVALAALESLRMYRHDETIRAKIQAAVSRRRSDSLGAKFDEYFADSLKTE